jgi:lipoprotein signal peptidase
MCKEVGTANMNVPAEKSYRKVLLVLVVLGTTLDQASKYSVFKWLYPGTPDRNYDLVPGVFELVAQSSDKAIPPNALADLRSISGPTLPYVNEGALFGLGQEYKGLANTVFTVISIAAAIAIVYWSRRRTAARELGLCVALGLILAGTLGNLYDRLIFSGVRDFLHFYWLRQMWGRDFPVFNFADCCLVIGAFFLLVQAYLHRPATESERTPEVALSAAANGTAK